MTGRRCWSAGSAHSITWTPGACSHVSTCADEGAMLCRAQVSAFGRSQGSWMKHPFQMCAVQVAKDASTRGSEGDDARPAGQHAYSGSGLDDLRSRPGPQFSELHIQVLNGKICFSSLCPAPSPGWGGGTRCLQANNDLPHLPVAPHFDSLQESVGCFRAGPTRRI